MTTNLVARVGEVLSDLSAGRTGTADWLGPGEACDLPFADLSVTTAMAAARRIVEEAGAPVDVVAQPAAVRAKRLLLADMDATIVTGETLDELAAVAGIADRIVPITARAMAGDIGFEQALIERVALLKGLPAQLLEETYARMRVTDGAGTLVATMRAQGAACVLISGGFTWFTERIAASVGFDAHEGNRLGVEKGVLSGTVDPPILGRDRKRAALIDHTERLGLTAMETMAVGDGANDIPMLLAAGTGVAFHGKPKVRAVLAEAGGAVVDHGDLTALLYIQGYRREQFVTG